MNLQLLLNVNLSLKKEFSNPDNNLSCWNNLSSDTLLDTLIVPENGLK